MAINMVQYSIRYPPYHMHQTYNMHRLNSEEPFFPVEIFTKPNRDSDSVRNSESDDKFFWPDSLGMRFYQF